MALSYFRKHQRAASLMFAFIFLSQSAYPSYLSVKAKAATMGGGQPVSASTSGMVDPYTGDFHYSVPLLTVPGPNGENVSIAANYHAGIRVDEKASWLGLGWDYNPGEISRQVVGAPDDEKDGYVTFSKHYQNDDGLYHYSAISYLGAFYSSNVLATPSYASPSSSSYNPTSAYNPFHVSPKKSMDVLSVDRVLNATERNSIVYGTQTSRFKRYSMPYRSLAYDHYMASGPVSGQMKPYFFGNMVLNENLDPGQTVSYSTAFNKKAQFYLENSAQKTIAAGSSEINSQNMVKSGNYIKYYTNTEINNSANLFDNTTQKGFLDYKLVSSGSRRDLAKVSGDHIGAFEITNPNGMTYHYSLAVYASEEIEKVQTGPNFDYTYRPEKYVNSWKLTAVTGPDYLDANNNHVADIGDAGYWIAYNYSLWSDNYQWTNIQYGLKDDIYSPKFELNEYYIKNYFSKVFVPKKSSITGKTEVYYLNYIQTSTHTALFVKSIRQDEQSYDKIAATTPSTPSTILPCGLLKLDRVILLRNEDLININSSAVPISGGDLNSHFSYSSCGSAQSDPGFMNLTKYNAYKAYIDSKALKSVALSQDYSLCPKYTCNINNHFSGLTTYYINTSPVENPVCNASTIVGYQTFSTYFTDDASASGKLTLNKITFLDLMSERVTPSIDFDYAKTDATKNPDFDASKTDLWGYYKSDWQYGGTHYPTSTSKDYTSAWSLRSINSPLGGTIQVEYESDDYTAEGFSDDEALVMDPLYLSVASIGGTVPYLLFPIQSYVLSGPGSAPSCNNFIFQHKDISDFLPASGSAQSLLVVPTVQNCSNPDPAGPYPSFYTVNLVGINNLSKAPLCTGGYPCTPSSGYTIYSADDWVESTPLISDYPFSCSGTGSYIQVSKSNAFPYVVVKSPKLYGGGIRVKTIKTIEPFKSSTFTESFAYENGYCPEVPKTLTMGAYDNPSYYSLLQNSKMAIEGLSSNVGYSKVTIKNISQNNVSNGSMVLTYSNTPIHNPISMAWHNTGKVSHCCDTYAGAETCGGTSTWEFPNPGVSTDDLCGGTDKRFHKVWDYTYSMDLKYDNSELLGIGLLITSEVFAEGAASPVSSTAYDYGHLEQTTHLREDYGNVYIRDKGGASFRLLKCVEGGTTDQSYSSCDVYDTYTPNSYYENHDLFLRSTTTTRDGISIIEQVLERDANTGTPTKTRTYDPTQGMFITKSAPAYQNSSYAGLGLKSVNESYKNQPVLMEHSQTLRFPYMGPSANIDEASDAAASIVVSESKNTYSTSYPYRSYNASTTQYENSTQSKNWWRLYETYARLLDDVTNYSSTTYNWRKLSEGTLYDLQNNKIEEKGLNDRKAASKWGYQNRYKLADISNANYNSFTFTGFEDKFLAAANTYHFGGEVTGGQYQYTSATQVQPAVNPRNPPTVFIVNPHTGYYLARVPAATDGPAFNTKNFEAGRTYLAKVWVHRSSPATAKLVIDLNGYLDLGGGSTSAITTHKEISKSDAANVTVGDWTLMSLEVIVPGNFDLASTHSMKVYVKNASTTAEAYFDDFAFHPKDAVMGGHVYEEKTGLLKAQLDNDNFATLYNYDNAGRVISTYKEYSGGIKKVSENQYHFAKP